MGYFSLTKSDFNSELIKAEYKSSLKQGFFCFGSSHFFCVKGFKKYFIEYAEIERAFRRVMLISNGNRKDYRMEALVIMSSGKEVANFGIKTTEEAVKILDKLKDRAPSALFVCPEKE